MKRSAGQEAVVVRGWPDFIISNFYHFCWVLSISSRTIPARSDEDRIGGRQINPTCPASDHNNLPVCFDAIALTGRRWLGGWPGAWLLFAANQLSRFLRRIKTTKEAFSFLAAPPVGLSGLFRRDHTGLLSPLSIVSASRFMLTPKPAPATDKDHAWCVSAFTAAAAAAAAPRVHGSGAVLLPGDNLKTVQLGWASRPLLLPPCGQSSRR